MKSRSIRSWCVYLATTAGLLCVIAVWGLGGVVAFVALVAASTALAASAAWGDAGRRAVPRIARVTLATGLIVPATVGLIAAFKFAGVLIVLALAATTPALISRVQTRLHAQGDPPAEEPKSAAPRFPAASGRLANGPATDPARELRSLDDEALCLAWRRSFIRLEAARSAMERLSVVEQRQQYLDEFQRRCPDGLAAWLASGARASSNPLPFLGDARRRAD